MKKENFYGMTVDVVNGRTYWQKGSFSTIAELVKHVKRYSSGFKHLVIYKMNDKDSLDFVEHKDSGSFQVDFASY